MRVNESRPPASPVSQSPPLIGSLLSGSAPLILADAGFASLLTGSAADAQRTAPSDARDEDDDQDRDADGSAAAVPVALAAQDTPPNTAAVDLSQTDAAAGGFADPHGDNDQPSPATATDSEHAAASHQAAGGHTSLADDANNLPAAPRSGGDSQSLETQLASQAAWQRDVAGATTAAEDAAPSQTTTASQQRQADQAAAARLAAQDAAAQNAGDAASPAGDSSSEGRSRTRQTPRRSTASGTAAPQSAAAQANRRAAADGGRESSSSPAAIAHGLSPSAATDSAMLPESSSTPSAPPAVASLASSVAQTAAAQAASVQAASVQAAAIAQAAGGSSGDPAATSSDALESKVAGVSPGASSGAAGAGGSGSKPAAARSDLAAQARLIHRISKAFTKLSETGGQIRMRLHPEHLGSVQLQMQVRGRSVEAVVTAENEAAKVALQQQLSELRQRLESQGLQVQRLEVQLNDSAADGGERSFHEGSGFPDGTGGSSAGGSWAEQRFWSQHRRSAGGASDPSDRRSQTAAAAVAAPIAGAATLRLESRSLDLRL